MQKRHLYDIFTSNMKIPISSSVLILLCLFLSSTSIAQTPPSTPPGDDTGVQASRFQTETELEKKALEKKEPKAPEIEIEKEAKNPSVEGPSFV